MPLRLLRAALLLPLVLNALVLAPALALAFLVYVGVMFGSAAGWAVPAATGALALACAGVYHAGRALRLARESESRWPRAAVLSLGCATAAYLLVRVLGRLEL